VITLEQVHELARLRIQEFPVTTLFLSLGGGRDARKAEIQLKDLIKKQRSELEGRGLSRPQLRSVESDFDQMLKLLQNLDRKGCRGLAVFSSSGAGLWRVHPLAQPVRDRLVVDAHPHVRPLSSFLNQFKRSVVLLLARDHAVIYVAHLGEIRRLAEERGDVPQEVRVGSVEERRIERHAEDRLHHFAKGLAERAAEVLRAQSAEHLVVGGAPEAVAAFEAHAPRALRDRTIARLALGPEAPSAEVLARVSEAVAAHERQRGTRMVETAIKEARTGGLGVAGVAATLRSFGRGEVAAIVVSSRLSRPGLACGRCPGLDLEARHCAACGGDLVQVPDVVEELIHRALGQSVEVSDLDGHPALEAAGGMAALLRYRRPGPAATVPEAGAAPGAQARR
jgi:peptide chain release factor subunit 1